MSRLRRAVKLCRPQASKLTYEMKFLAFHSLTLHILDLIELILWMVELIDNIFVISWLRSYEESPIRKFWNPSSLIKKIKLWTQIDKNIKNRTCTTKQYKSNYYICNTNSHVIDENSEMVWGRTGSTEHTHAIAMLQM